VVGLGISGPSDLSYAKFRFSGAVAKTVIAPADRVKCPGRDLQRTGEKGPTTPR